MKGTTQLNSNYRSVPAVKRFDFSSTITETGIKGNSGFATGRTVILEGLK